MLKSHYAPAKRLIFDDALALDKLRTGAETVGVICFDKYVDGFDKSNQVLLSARGDLNDAAKHLFAAMRSLDAGIVDVIYAIKFPEVGLGRAINDRLMRASAK